MTCDGPHSTVPRPRVRVGGSCPEGRPPLRPRRHADIIGEIAAPRQVVALPSHPCKFRQIVKGVALAEKKIRRGGAGGARRTSGDAVGALASSSCFTAWLVVAALLSLVTTAAISLILPITVRRRGRRVREPPPSRWARKQLNFLGRPSGIAITASPWPPACPLLPRSRASESGGGRYPQDRLRTECPG